MDVVKYERAFLFLGAALLVACMLALVYNTVVMGMRLPGRSGTLDPEQVDTTPPFDDPRVHKTGPNSYEAVVIGYAWGFTPEEIRVPAGADVTFIATTRDVIHGFHVERTRLNMTLLPGQVARQTYRFDEPGRYLLLCHEYCGSGHHAMYGHVVVEDPAAASDTAQTPRVDAAAP